MRFALILLFVPGVAFAQAWSLPPSSAPNPRAEAIKRDMCAHASYEDSDAGRAIKTRDCGGYPTFDDLRLRGQ